MSAVQSFKEWMLQVQQRTEVALDAFLPSSAIAPERLHEAMRYAVLGGGKRVRPLLAHAAGELASAPAERLDRVSCAVELIHAYSLVHDDMPAMDDDDLRRGRPTVHRQWDEATALLAGDALQSLGFELIATAALPDSARVTLLAGFARAAGIHGMVGGQEADIAAETAARPLSLDQIIALQRGKTGALITWSASAGAVMAGADAAPLRAFGDAIGLAFQITDDILDVEGSAATMGKAVQKDAAAGKATFVSLLGLQGAKDQALALLQTADAALIPYGATAATLRETAQFVITRQN